VEFASGTTLLSTALVSIASKSEAMVGNGNSSTPLEASKLPIWRAAYTSNDKHILKMQVASKYFILLGNVLQR
jgi:hypothetical protein